MSFETESQIEAWMQSFEALPEERRDLIQRWFAMQKLIIENAGVEAAEWFGYVQWAMDNPLDYRFVLDFPDRGERANSPETSSARFQDTSREKDETKKARELVGAAVRKTAVADGPGMKANAKSEGGLERELFDRFMKEQMGKVRK